MRQLIYLKTSEIARDFNITTKQATQIKQLIRGTLDPFKFESVVKREAECYNPNKNYYLILTAINEIIEGHGIEAIEGEYVDSYHFNFTHDYVNTGDTYSASVVRDNQTGRFYLACWGDFVDGC